MTEYTTPAGNELAELDQDQGGELVPFPMPATADDEAPGRTDRRPTVDPEAGDPDDPDAVPVDPPPLPASALGPVWERETDRRPVLPAWVTDPATVTPPPSGRGTTPCIPRRSTRCGCRCTASGWPAGRRGG